MDSEQPKFRGKDAAECEEFIAAILKHAFTQGKQRDDQWMADFAATCLETGALRWWSGLNQEVQGSWNLLRRAMFSRYRPLFHGGSGEEAENFIRAVWDKAIDEEKQEDNKWMAMYALSCLAGEGLRWYASLDSDTQENWKKLQQAVLVQYPRDTPDGALPNTIPSPAAASAPNVTRRGRIRLSNSSSTTPHYISKKYSSNEKRISSTSSLADALEFEWNPGSGNQHMLSIPNSQFPGYDVLGLRWCAKIPKGERDLSNFLSLCAVDSQTKSTAFSSVSGDVVIDAWKVSRQGTSGALAVSVLVDGEELAGRWNAPYKHILFGYKSYEPHKSYDAEMVFEPI